MAVGGSGQERARGRGSGVLKKKGTALVFIKDPLPARHRLGA